MSVFENKIKQLENIAPDMKFKDALMLAREAEKDSKNASEANYVVLLLMELMGFDSNGNAPDVLRQKILDEKDGFKRRQYLFAIKQAQYCQGMHFCGFPGYEKAMSRYETMFLHNQFNLLTTLKNIEEDWKTSLKNST